MKLKTYEDLMVEIDSNIVRDPILISKQIKEIDIELAQLEKEMLDLGINVESKKDIEFWDTPLSKGVKYIEFDKNGNVVKMFGINQAKDFRK